MRYLSNRDAIGYFASKFTVHILILPNLLLLLRSASQPRHHPLPSRQTQRTVSVPYSPLRSDGHPVLSTPMAIITCTLATAHIPTGAASVSCF